MKTTPTSCIKTLILFYRSAQQQQVYANYLAESRMVRLLHRAYTFLNQWELGYIALAFHGFRTTAQFYPSHPLQGELIAFAAEANQRRNIQYITKLSGGALQPFFVPETTDKMQRLGSLLTQLTRTFRKGGWRRLKAKLRIIRQIEKREGWVVALNVASFLYNYAVFRHAFGPEARVAFSANDFSPIPLAFKAAAAANGLKQLFTMHGQISSSASGNVFPQLDYDVAFLYGDASLQSYRHNGEPTGTVFLTGFPGQSEPLRPVDGNLKTIGIALPNYYDAETQTAIEQIADLYNDCQIIIRCHPQMAKKPNFPSRPWISISNHADLKSFADVCDFAIAGNTGAQIDLLKFGCPVLYCSTLDKLGYDDMGLVREKVLMEQGVTAFDATAINTFFNLGWPEKFRRFDAFYLIDESQRKSLGEDITRAYQKLL